MCARTWMLGIVDDDCLDDPDAAMATLKLLVLFLDLEPEDTRQRLMGFLEDLDRRESPATQEVVGAMFANL